MTQPTNPITFELDPAWGFSDRSPGYSPERGRGDGVCDVAISADGLVFAFVRNEPVSRVVIYDERGHEESSWGEGLFDRPHGITIGHDGFVYLVEDYGCAVRKFTLDGSLVGTFGPVGIHSDTGADWENPDLLERLRGVRTEGGPPFNNPTRVALGADLDVYVSDGYNNCKVHQFEPDGTLRRSWGSSGTGLGEFHLVHAIALSEAGRLYVGDRENSRVQVFTLDGTPIESWSDARRPHAVEIGPDGLVYVGEARVRAGRYTFTHGPAEKELPPRVTVRDERGTILGGLSTTDGLMDPHGVAIDVRGNVFVADAGRLRKYVRH